MRPGYRKTSAIVQTAIVSLLVVPLLACRSRHENALSEDAMVVPALAMDAALPDPKPKPGPVRIVYPAAPGSFVKLCNELAPSVVHLRSTTKVKGGPADLFPDAKDSHALGTAIVWDRKGYLLTSEHIIASAPEIEVVLGGQRYPVTVVGRDSKLDLALLKTGAPVSLLKPVRRGDSDNVSVGEWVLALGNPLGDEVTASAGILSSLGSTENESISRKTISYQSFLRTDAKINVGNSGGPLIDTSGAVIGINTAIATHSGTIALAIPINRAAAVFAMLEKNGEVTRTWLGVFIHPVTMSVAKERRLEVATGALVSELVPGSPATLAGILPGDVILEFDGQKVDHRSLPLIASTSEVGKRIEVLVWRNGAPRTLILRSESMPK